MNILIIGTNDAELALLELCLKSKFLDKIYTASSEPLDGIPNIEYNNYEELAKKSRALNIDIALTANRTLLKDGITDELKRFGVNIIGINKKWSNLDSRIISKNLAAHYSINVPEIIKAPITFPVVLKTDLPESTQIAESMSDLIEKKEILIGKKNFLEEYMQGEVFYLLSLWDGKNIVSFNPPQKLTEVQQDRLELYKTKLNFMLSDEKADFTGFITSKLLWTRNDWYLLEYIIYPSVQTSLNTIEKDFLYILNLAVYQKLNEL